MIPITRKIAKENLGIAIVSIVVGTLSAFLTYDLIKQLLTPALTHAATLLAGVAIPTALLVRHYRDLHLPKDLSKWEDVCSVLWNAVTRGYTESFIQRNKDRLHLLPIAQVITSLEQINANFTELESNLPRTEDPLMDSVHKAQIKQRAKQYQRAQHQIKQAAVRIPQAILHATAHHSKNAGNQAS